MRGMDISGYSRSAKSWKPDMIKFRSRREGAHRADPMDWPEREEGKSPFLSFRITFLDSPKRVKNVVESV